MNTVISKLLVYIYSGYNKDVYYEMINAEDISLEEPEIMLFLIVELVSSTCYSAILYKEPADIDTIKPYLFKTVRAIIREHTIR